MLRGDPSTFAIESNILKAYANSGVALGCFIIHINGIEYGLRKPDASMLACSVDEVRNRITRQGRHICEGAAGESALALADLYSSMTYGRGDGIEVNVDQASAVFEQMHDNRTVWAPDGDEAFDDGSIVLQFDIDRTVRLIGFRRNTHGNIYGVDEATLQDLTLQADDFYRTLSEWHLAFWSEWHCMEKAFRLH